MYKESDSNDPQVILSHAIDELKREAGEKFDIEKNQPRRARTSNRHIKK